MVYTVPVGTLYIVATPMGNMQDITIRALETLRSVDSIACEDTRHTVKLLNAHNIKKRLISCHAHNAEKSSEQISAILEQDQDVAYVTDAGTPGVSDPGAVMVDLIRGKGYPVLPIPGASAVTTLVSVSGCTGKTFIFDGFLSPKKGKRRKRLQELINREENFILYESPHRIVKLMQDIADLAPERTIFIGREMTKMHEEYITGTAEKVLEDLEGRKTILGEFSVLVYGKKKG